MIEGVNLQFVLCMHYVVAILLSVVDIGAQAGS
jgi:hypothetical protein